MWTVPSVSSRMKGRWSLLNHFSPELDPPTSRRPAQATQWRVILYHDARHQFDDMVNALEQATACQFDFAIEICHVCQDQGRAVCFQGDKDACHEIAEALRALNFQVEVDDY